METVISLEHVYPFTGITREWLCIVQVHVLADSIVEGDHTYIGRQTLPKLVGSSGILAAPIRIDHERTRYPSSHAS